MKTDKRMPWFGDIANHPNSPLQPFYNSGRCQEPDHTVCPYCGARHDDHEELHNGDVECIDCGLSFRVEASFGYGFSSYPNRCEHGHIFVFSSQHEYEGKYWRISHCILCEKQSASHPEFTPLTWLAEYDDPDHFDPDGILDTGRSIEEQIDDRLHGPGTPVLDALFEGQDDGPYSYPPLSSRWSKAIRALDRMEKQNA